MTSSDVSIHVSWLAGVVAALIVAGCAEDVPITTEPGLAHSEWDNRIGLGEPWPETLIVVGTPEVLAAAADVLTASLAPMLSRPPPSTLWVQLITMSPEQAADTMDWLVTCRTGNDPCELPQPPTVTYRAAPYGYATDIDQWTSDATCLLRGDPDCELDEAAAPTFSSDFHSIVMLWLEDDALCNAGDVCAEQPIERVRRSAESERRIPGYFHVVGEVPERESLDVVVAEEYGPRHGESYRGLPVNRRVAFDSNGDPLCVLRETLPITGPITRCEQLEHYGRTFDSIDANGHAVCDIRVQRASSTLPTEPLPPPPAIYYEPDYPGGYPVLHFDVIHGSVLALRCVLDVDE